MRRIIFAGFFVVASLSFCVTTQAMPVAVPEHAAPRPEVILAAGGCGVGRFLDGYGYCRVYGGGGGYVVRGGGYGFRGGYVRGGYVRGGGFRAGGFRAGGFRGGGFRAGGFRAGGFRGGGFRGRR